MADEKGESRWMVQISDTHVEIDPEVTIRGDRTSGFTLTADFCAFPVMFGVPSRIQTRDPEGCYDMHAILTDAYEQGVRLVRLEDYRIGSLPAGEQSD